MNEKSFWSRYVRPVLHQPNARRVAWKVQDAFNAGLPDVDFCLHGVAGKLELKYVKEYPKRASTTVKVATSPNQKRFLAEWAGAGGIALVLVGVDHDWYLLDEADADDLTRRELEDRSLGWGGFDKLEALPDVLEDLR